MAPKQEKGTPPVSKFKQAHKVFSFEPLHVALKDTPVKGRAILIPVEDLNFSQRFDPTYATKPVYGRMDPIVTYQHTKRSLNIQFKCQAHHVFDTPGGVVNNIRNINLLTQLLYPAYFEHGSTIDGDPLAILGAPPFFRIRYGNYIGSFNTTGGFHGEEIGGLTGYITGFSHQLGKIARNVALGKQGKDKAFRALPREIAVSFNFEVIHDKLTGWYKGEFSPNGYGYNFPYNAGHFGKPGGPRNTAGEKSDGSTIKTDTSTNKGKAGAMSTKERVAAAQKFKVLQSDQHGPNRVLPEHK
jgi:hypothetical protein